MTPIDPRTDPTWDQDVAQNPAATIFHTSAWARVLSETYGHKPSYLRLTDRGGSPALLLPLMEIRSLWTGARGVSLPFSDSCEPLLFEPRGSSGTVIDRLAEVGKARDWKYCELRGRSFADIASVPWKKFYSHTINLTPPPTTLFDRFDASVRRAIRKAQQASLTVEVASTLVAVREFYDLHCRTRRKHGLPPQPFLFFRKIHEHVIQQRLGYLVIARLASRPVAAAVFFHFGKNALYKFGASDERFLAHRGNNLVMWEGIKHAAELGLATLHLGRTDLEHSGLRRFKLSLGSEEEVLPYFRFDPSQSAWLAPSPALPSSLPAAVFRRLPLTVNRLTGRLVYPHLH